MEAHLYNFPRQQTAEAAQARDDLIAGFLELRDKRLPALNRHDREVLRSIDHFILYGGLNEPESVRLNLLTVNRMLERARRPKSRIRQVARAVARWLQKVEEIN